MNNNWKNADNIKITLLNQDKKIILNENHNGRVIFIDDNECEILDKNYINNKNNNLSWRHIFSYLDNDSIEKIMNEIQKEHMKKNVLKINHHISFNDYSYDCRRIIEEVYDCQYNHNDNPEEKKRKRDIVNEESWEIVEWDERNGLEEARRNVVCGNINKIDSKMKSLNYLKHYESIRYKCIFRKANGSMCGKQTNEKIRLMFNRQDDKKLVNYCNLWIHDIDCCGTHKRQYDNLKTQDKKYQKIEDTLLGIGYKEKNGILCKVCE